MKCLPSLITSSALALVLAVSGSALAQTSMGSASASQTKPAGATNASVTGAQKIPLANIPSAQQITGAPVVDSSGKQFGRVLSVKTGSDGKPDKVKIGFTTPDAMGRAALVKAGKLTLDPAKQAIVADLSPSEVSQLASTASSAAMGGAGGGAGGVGASAGGSSGGKSGNY